MMTVNGLADMREQNEREALQKRIAELEAELKKAHWLIHENVTARTELEAENARLRENRLRLVKALDRIDNHVCSGEAQYGCQHCAKAAEVVSEALEGR